MSIPDFGGMKIVGQVVPRSVSSEMVLKQVCNTAIYTQMKMAAVDYVG